MLFTFKAGLCSCIRHKTTAKARVRKERSPVPRQLVSVAAAAGAAAAAAGSGGGWTAGRQAAACPIQAAASWGWT